MTTSDEWIDDPDGTFVIGSRALSATSSPRQRTHYLLFTNGPEQGRRIEINEDPVVIGRSHEVDITLQDTGTSKRHCRVVLRNARVRVTDLGSTNGTYLDDKKLEETAILPPESFLEIGSHVLKHEFRDRAEVEKSDQISEELETAQKYVQSVLPPPMNEKGISIEWTFVPSSTLGGDSFGYHWIDDDSLALYLLDVSGHGVAAAMHSVSVLNTIRHESLPHTDFLDPQSVLTKLNDVFQMDEHGGVYFTLWYGVYDIRTRQLTYSVAGHPAALLATGQDMRQLKTKGMPIGLYPGAPYRNETAEIDEFAVLYVFSDGVFEVRTIQGADWSFGELQDKLLHLRQTEASHSGEILKLVENLTGQRKWEDDFTIFTVRFTSRTQ